MYFRAGAIGLILPCVMYPLSRVELFPAIETPFVAAAQVSISGRMLGISISSIVSGIPGTYDGYHHEFFPCRMHMLQHVSLSIM